jgi:superfamily II DNA or RNA helicase
MSKYPNIDDINFYAKINKIYNEYKVKKDNKTIEQICNPKQFKLQLPQQFLAEFISPKTNYNGILIYHRIGSGKTCTAIQIAEKWKKIKHIIVVLPAALKGNFKNELRSQCGKNNYLNDLERNLLSKLDHKSEKYKEIIKNSDMKIDKYYTIYSYNKFTDLAKENKINLRNTLLIIDEIQNMISEDGVFYQTLYNMINKSPDDLRIVLLSATPMFDKPNEIALTLNLLKLNKEIPIGKEFDKQFIDIKKIKKNGTLIVNMEPKNISLFKTLIKGKISYFRGAPPIAFPKMKIKYINCVMSRLQYESYKKILKNTGIDNIDNIDVINDKQENNRINIDIVLDKNVSHLPNNFYIGTRIVSNIVFPNRKLGKTGLKSLTNEKILDDLHKYSVKFYEIINKISKCSGKIFVYSSFKEYGGIKSFVKVLEAFGYSSYAKEGAGKNKYAVWSGDEDLKMREEIKAIYNNSNNLNGSKIKIIIGSIAIKEGISFTGVRQVHLLEPYWNESRILQIVGRASRFCSHIMLPEEKRNVKVYIYIATHPKINKTIDEYMANMISQKSKIISIFEHAIKESAIDCYLNKNANQNGDHYDCDI